MIIYYCVIGKIIKYEKTFFQILSSVCVFIIQVVILFSNTTTSPHKKKEKENVFHDINNE